MPANRFGIDLGEVYRTKENIRGARTRNTLAELQLSEAQREIAGRPEKERLARERKIKLEGLRGKAVRGDTEAEQQLLAIDPEGGAKFIEAIAKMDERKREMVKQAIDEIGRMSVMVLRSKNPEQTYNLMRDSVSPEARKKLPEKYSPGFMEVSLSKATAMDKLLEVKSVRMGGEDVLVKGGMEVERAKRPVKPTKTGAGGLKSADESLMYRMSVELLGGIFDESGNITALDPELRGKVQAIATEASNIFKQKGNITRAQAVKEAATKFGVTVPAAMSGEINQLDPMSLESY